MHEARDGHLRDKCSQSRDKSKKDRRLSRTKGEEECPTWTTARRPVRQGSSLRQIALGRFSDRCDDCCVSLHRSGHPVDPGVGWGRELRGLPWRPPLPRHWQRCSIEPFWLLGRICFQPSAAPRCRHPLIAPAERGGGGWTWLRLTHQSPDSLYCPLWVTQSFDNSLYHITFPRAETWKVKNFSISFSDKNFHVSHFRPKEKVTWSLFRNWNSFVDINPNGRNQAALQQPNKISVELFITQSWRKSKSSTRLSKNKYLNISIIVINYLRQQFK